MDHARALERLLNAQKRHFVGLQRASLRRRPRFAFARVASRVPRALAAAAAAPHAPHQLGDGGVTAAVVAVAAAFAAALAAAAVACVAGRHA